MINLHVLPKRITTVIGVTVFKVVPNCFALGYMDISKSVWGAEGVPEFGFHLQIFNDHL